MNGVVLITGASSGIGKSTAEYLTQQGCRVFGTSRRPDAHNRLFVMLPLDIRDPLSIQRCVQSVIEQAGRIDVLVNNAAIDGAAAASEETSMEQLRHVFETNFFGVVQMTNAVLPIMRTQGSGKIINVSSIGGFIALPPFFGAYNASKHALEGYTETLRYEAKLFNIHVSLVEPGYMRTNIGQTCEQPAYPLEVYEQLRQRVYAVDMNAIQWGRDPAVVAKTIGRIVKKRLPALRYPVSEDGVMMSMAKGFLPFALIEWFFTWLFLRGDWQPDAPGMLRRLFLDAQFSDRMTGYLMKSLAVCLVAGVILILASRQ